MTSLKIRALQLAAGVVLFGAPMAVRGQSAITSAQRAAAQNVSTTISGLASFRAAVAKATPQQAAAMLSTALAGRSISASRSIAMAALDANPAAALAILGAVAKDTPQNTQTVTQAAVALSITPANIAMTIVKAAPDQINNAVVAVLAMDPRMAVGLITGAVDTEASKGPIVIQLIARVAPAQISAAIQAVAITAPIALASTVRMAVSELPAQAVSITSAAVTAAPTQAAAIVLGAVNAQPSAAAAITRAAVTAAPQTASVIVAAAAGASRGTASIASLAAIAASVTGQSSTSIVSAATGVNVADVIAAATLPTSALTPPPPSAATPIIAAITENSQTVNASPV